MLPEMRDEVLICSQAKRLGVISHTTPRQPSRVLTNCLSLLVEWPCLFTFRLRGPGAGRFATWVRRGVKPSMTDDSRRRDDHSAVPLSMLSTSPWSHPRPLHQAQLSPPSLVSSSP